jgi:hypothetical protein
MADKQRERRAKTNIRHDVLVAREEVHAPDRIVCVVFLNEWLLGRGACAVHVAGTSYRARVPRIRMHSRAADYYRRGLEAQQYAAQAAAEPRIKQAFEQVADNLVYAC